MNKLQLITTVSLNLGISQKLVKSVLNEVIERIGETVANGEEIKLIDFGTFSPRFRKGRKCRNPQNGEIVEIADATIPFFKVGKKLKERVNNNLS